MTLAATKSKYGKISKSYILTPPHPQGHGMSLYCEQPIDELAVQIWLLNYHPNLKYCTSFVSGPEWRTNRQTDGRTDDPNTRCPRQTFQAGGIIIFSDLVAAWSIVLFYIQPTWMVTKTNPLIWTTYARGKIIAQSLTERVEHRD